MRIAVIEDERPIREGLVHILNKISPEYQVVGSAENGREGLILLEEQDPDLILLDIQMPDMNGLQMLKEGKTGDSQLSGTWYHSRNQCADRKERLPPRSYHHKGI